jgi:hypothetical protein
MELYSLFLQLYFEFLPILGIEVVAIRPSFLRIFPSPAMLASDHRIQEPTKGHVTVQPAPRAGAVSSFATPAIYLSRIAASAKIRTHGFSFST